VLSAGLGPDAPVTRVSSRPLKTVGAGTPIYEAWRVLLEAGVHHLPVTRDGEIAGVLTATDLLKHTAQGPVAVLRSVERFASRDGLPTYGVRVAEMAAALLAGGLEAAVIAGLVARLNGALLGRLLAFAEADLGPAPAPYAWVVFGSEGRMEQVLLTDQDNGLVYADEGGAHRDWFQRLADMVNADLEAAGFHPSAGGRMARAWHGTLSDWRRRLAESVAGRPGEAAVYFDMRRTGGGLEVGPLEDQLSRAAGDPRFVRQLAQGALQFGPPSSLVLRLKGTSSTVDLKLHGIAPVVFLARCYALEVGSRSRATLERLEDAARAGLMDESLHASVSEAYRFLLGLRLRVQLRRLAEGKKPTSEVALAELSGIERSRLKDAFRAVKSWQERAAYHYQATVA
jgi:CBS domain-containing protein